MSVLAQLPVILALSWSWFNGPLRITLGVAGLIVILLLLIAGVLLIRDFVRYRRISRM